MLAVPLPKVTPGEERDSHGVEIAGQHDAPVRRALVGRVCRRVIGVPGWDVVGRIADRQLADESDRLHAGKGGEVLAQAVEELDALIWVRILCFEQLDFAGQQVLDVEPWVGGGQTCEASDEQAGANQQHQRDG